MYLFDGVVNEMYKALVVCRKSNFLREEMVF